MEWVPTFGQSLSLVNSLSTMPSHSPSHPEPCASQGLLGFQAVGPQGPGNTTPYLMDGSGQRSCALSFGMDSFYHPSGWGPWVRARGAWARAPDPPAQGPGPGPFATGFGAPGPGDSDNQRSRTWTIQIQLVALQGSGSIRTFVPGRWIFGTSVTPWPGLWPRAPARVPGPQARGSDPGTRPWHVARDEGFGERVV